MTRSTSHVVEAETLRPGDSTPRATTQVCVPSYLLASNALAVGMSWWQAVACIIVANFIVLIPLVLNGHAGTKYGVPFPVLARASFGVRGAHVPVRA